ncbi:MAG: hypothetical protein Q7J78_07365, partial [Clostridiales bacterium]|nr:hypothetical protein [Clostridiales bacterium]
DEINATEEHVLLNDVKKVLRKHSGDAQKIAAVCEFFKVISGGASLEEILQVSIDETLSPTAVSEIINGNEY